jgi:DNA polymerase III epsilon subunit-like protein
VSYEKDSKSRIVVLDIETVSLNPQDPEGCFDAMTGRIASIALLIDTGYDLTPVVIIDEDERKILQKFWATIGRDDLLVGHNLLEFDIKFIRQRSWILNVEPSIHVNLRKYYTEDVFDVMQVWTNWGYKMKGAGLDNIAKALGLGGKTGHGSEVAVLWANKQYKQLMDYNLADTLITYQCYCRMTYRQPLLLPVAEGVALPTFIPGDSRELVPLPRQKKEPEAPLTLQAPRLNLPDGNSVPRQSNGHADKSRTPIFYRQHGGEVILSGKGTFQVKRAIKEIYQGYGKKISDKPALYEWHMRPEKFEPFADFCRGLGVPLEAQGAA